MDYSDLFKSGLGAIVGFLLAQLVNVFKLFYDWAVQPRLQIEKINTSWRILSHSTEVGSGELCREEVFGFRVRNGGRRVATGIRCQLLKIEYRGRDWPEFADVHESADNLRTFVDRGEGDQIVTLVPNAAALFQVASWREDYDVLLPSIGRALAYYEEICADAIEYRFTIVAIDDQARFVTKQLTIAKP